MNAMIVLERTDGVRFQVTAGAPDGGPGRRHLTFSVPDTDDSLRLDWDQAVDILAGAAIPVSLRVGTLAAYPAELTDDGYRFFRPRQTDYYLIH